MNDMLLQVEPLIPALRRYARALLRNPTSADDLVQDCLERAVSRWHQRREGNTRSWLFTILHNLAVNQFRQSAARGRHVTIDETNEDDFGQDAVQEQKLMYQDVLNKLAKLPEDQRAVLLPVAVEDLSYTEAAKVLDIPIGRLCLGRWRDGLQPGWAIRGGILETDRERSPQAGAHDLKPARAAVRSARLFHLRRHEWRWTAISGRKDVEQHGA